MVKVGLLATIKAKPGKEAAVTELLSGAVALANQEAKTVVWFSFRIDDSSFGVFDAFADESGRKAHLEGEIAKALMAKAEELLAEPPSIKPVDLLGVKLSA
ncbi:MAG: antibiotic biosynthesis monooxygenase [Polyangiaceae bacterium]|nr:antibiotic biosynthesis monooxygenase [Myxococcales bacterium]MCB9585323.1 antibiotic biosynthesis monooxygenase [Polyangiaceae bacterium]MCB9606660.1 antibiotic biosynthesis monooxygenase [Polyangiaceae bacterium]